MQKYKWKVPFSLLVDVFTRTMNSLVTICAENKVRGLFTYGQVLVSNKSTKNILASLMGSVNMSSKLNSRE